MTSRALVPVDPTAPTIALVLFAHPFAPPRRVVMPRGHAASVYLAAADFTPPAEVDLVLIVDGAPVDRNRAGGVVPAHGLVAQIRPTFGGGDISGILGSLATIALAVAVPVVGPALGLGVIGTAALGVGAGLVGSLALSALSPTPDNSGPDGGHLYDISRQSNRARLHQPVPVVLGRRKAFPDLAAPLVREPHGQDLFVRALYCFAAGEYQIEDIEIGGAPIDDVVEAEYELRTGAPGEPPIALYVDSIDEDEVGAEVLKSHGWVRRETREGATEIRVLFDFPEGLFHLDKRGGADPFPLHIDLRYRKVGASVWIDHLVNHRIAANRRSYRLAYHWKVNADPGQYEVEVRRRTVDDTNDTRNFSLLRWVSTQTIRYQPAVAPNGLALLALRLEATQSFSGSVGAISAVVTTIALDWDPDARAWTKRPTRNPAALFRYVAQHPASQFPLADDELALDELEDWAERCAEKGWTYDRVFDRGGTVEDALRDIAAVGRATPHLRIDGKLGVVRDGPRSAPGQMVGPETAADLQIERTWRDLPHGLICEYVDPERDWTSAEVIAYRDGFTGVNATVFERLRLDAVTSRAMAWRLGRYHLAQGQLRPDQFRWTTDIDGLAFRRGDCVDLNWPTNFVGLASGRVREAALDGDGRATAIRLDEHVDLDGQTNAVARIRAMDGAMETRAIASVGDGGLITLASPFALTVERGCLAHVGVAGGATELIVTEIRPKGDLQADIVAVRHAPEIEDADVGVVPPYDPRLSQAPSALVRPDAPIIGTPAVGLDRSRQTGDLRLVILIPVRFPPSIRAPIDRIEARWRKDETDAWTADSFSADTDTLELAPVERGAGYVAQVRSIADATGLRVASAWVETSIAIAATAMAPAAPTGLAVITVVDANLDGVLSFGVEARWDAPDTEPAYFELAWRRSEGLHDDGTGFVGVGEPAYDEPGAWTAEPLIEGRERAHRMWRVRDQVAYAFRLRALNALGDASPWSAEIAHEVTLDALPQRRPANLAVYGGPRAFRFVCEPPLDRLWRRVRFFRAAVDDRDQAAPISDMIAGRSFSYAAASADEAGYFWARAYGPGDQPGGWNAEAGVFARVGSMSLDEIEESAGRYFAAEPYATASGVGANTIVNAGFELGLASWRLEDEARARLTDGGGRYGPAALEIDALATGDNIRVHQEKWVDVRPGSIWTVGCDAQRSVSNPGAFIAVNWRDSAGGRIGGQTFDLFPGPPILITGWRPLDFRTVAPDNAVRASLYVASAAGVAGKVRIDGVRFVERPAWSEVEGDGRPEDHATATAIGRTWLFNGDFEAGLGAGDAPIGWDPAPFADEARALMSRTGGRHGSNCVRLRAVDGPVALAWLGASPPRSRFMRADEGDAFVLRLYQRSSTNSLASAALRLTAYAAADPSSAIAYAPAADLFDASPGRDWRRWRRKVTLPTGTRFVSAEIVVTGTNDHPVWVDAVDVLEAPSVDDLGDSDTVARVDPGPDGPIDRGERSVISAPAPTDLRATQWLRRDWTTIATVTFETRGFDVTIDWWLEARGLADATPGDTLQPLRWQLLRDGWPIVASEEFGESAVWRSFSRIARDRPPGGRHRYELQARDGRIAAEPAGEARKIHLRAVEAYGGSPP